MTGMTLIAVTIVRTNAIASSNVYWCCDIIERVIAIREQATHEWRNVWDRVGLDARNG